MKPLLPLLLAFTLTAGAQETVERTAQTAYRETETFHVLKAARKVRHGLYQKTDFRNSLVEEGYYNNGQKDSTWTEYWNSEKQRSTGRYSHDERTGQWAFYDSKGVLQQQYDYSTQEVVFDASAEESKDIAFKVINGTDTFTTVLDRPPLFIGGKSQLRDRLSRSIKIPPAAFGNPHPTTSVVVAFVIDEQGKASHYRVVRNAGLGYDEEAIRTVRLLEGYWIPGVLYGKKVATEYMLSLGYKIAGGAQ